MKLSPILFPRPSFEIYPRIAVSQKKWSFRGAGFGRTRKPIAKGGEGMFHKYVFRWNGLQGIMVLAVIVVLTVLGGCSGPQDVTITVHAMPFAIAEATDTISCATTD